MKKISLVFGLLIFALPALAMNIPMPDMGQMPNMQNMNIPMPKVPMPKHVPQGSGHASSKSVAKGAHGMDLDQMMREVEAEIAAELAEWESDIQEEEKEAQAEMEESLNELALDMGAESKKFKKKEAALRAKFTKDQQKIWEHFEAKEAQIKAKLTKKLAHFEKNNKALEAKMQQEIAVFEQKTMDFEKKIKAETANMFSTGVENYKARVNQLQSELEQAGHVMEENLKKHVAEFEKELMEVEKELLVEIEALNEDSMKEMKELMEEILEDSGGKVKGSFDEAPGEEVEGFLGQLFQKIFSLFSFGN